MGELALIDYGAGNLHSVANALKAAGAANVRVTADPERVARADRVVLPGVGAFGACAAALRGVPGMIDALGEAVLGRGRPFLGVCVGMQLLADAGAEHGEHAGLGWIAGRVERLRPAGGERVPHMGWNAVEVLDPVLEAGDAYFTHSYAFVADDGADVAAVTEHGGRVVAAVRRGNMLGVQFHPEKSQGYGLRLLRRFLDWRP